MIFTLYGTLEWFNMMVQSSSSLTQMWNVISFDCEYLYSHKTFKCKTKSCVYHRNGKLGAWSSLIHMTIKVDLIAQRDGCCTFLMRFHLIIHKLLTWLHTQTSTLSYDYQNSVGSLPCTIIIVIRIMHFLFS